MCIFRFELEQLLNTVILIVSIVSNWNVLLNFNRDPEMISITSAPEAPPPRIRILDSRAREVETVRIGDKLTFRIEIPEDSEWINS